MKKKLLLLSGLLCSFLCMPSTICHAQAADTSTLTINANTSALDASSAISPLLYGLFLEDINFSVDGGMYAQMIKNGSFEYGALAKNSNKHAYTVSNKETISFEVVNGALDGSCLNENNPSYAMITNTSDAMEGIGNKGHVLGMAIQKDAVYHFSAFLRGLDGYTGPVTVCIDDLDGNILGEAKIPELTEEWTKYELSFTATETANKGLRFWIKLGQGKIAVDMIFLFPEDTYKGRPNGIRKDVGEYLEALTPRFLRFPGGCATEGTTKENQYSWKDSIGNGMSFTINGEETIGDVSTRPTSLNIWHNSSSMPYYMSYGLGFYEYFLLCEDLNCLPVPILNAGMTCPIQSGNGYTYVDENSEEFQVYIQDALDLAEFCRGGADTKWGAIRIAMGHEEPFPLKYIGIGNEQWQREYYSHFERFKEAFAKAAEENPEIYGDLELIVGNGPASTDRFAWDQIKVKGKDFAGLVDEHYYETPEWFLANTNRYDYYDRESVPVFLGEYAAKSNTMKAALAEAAYMTGLERNSDIVKMACYAPLFGNDKANQWEPDMMFLANDSLYGTVNYYVQKMFSNSQGIYVLDSELSEDTNGIYHVATIDEDGTIALKLVNTTGEATTLSVTLENAENLASNAELITLKSDSEEDGNTKTNKTAILPKESTLKISDSFQWEVPGYSVTIMEIPATE